MGGSYQELREQSAVSAGGQMRATESCFSDSPCVVLANPSLGVGGSTNDDAESNVGSFCGIGWNALLTTVSYLLMKVHDFYVVFMHPSAVSVQSSQTPNMGSPAHLLFLSPVQIGNQMSKRRRVREWRVLLQRLCVRSSKNTRSSSSSSKTQ